MKIIDYVIFAVYFIGVLAVGFYFYRRNKNREDYYVGGRDIASSHIGLSIVATDVGGGFSVGLGGLGFVMGLSGSWLLFTGLVGAWLAAIFTVPVLKKLDQKQGYYTYPDFLRSAYGPKVAMTAAVISGIGYLGFTGAQILAGAKLAAGSVLADVQWIDPQTLAMYVMAIIVLAYTVLGGLKAVIYTDTIQWIILLVGLTFFGLPFAFSKVGGWAGMQAALPPAFFTLTNVSITQIINWFVTIIPIWFVAMTLYQRVYATRSVKEARKAFFIAGLLEYPVMAFLGVALGMMARVILPDVEPEMGMPMLLRDSLPIGVTGIVIAAYFSAIMSTADSCLIASSGNWVNDIYERWGGRKKEASILVSQIATLIVGVLALVLASQFRSVLELILHAYAFMVSGLLVPTVAAYFIKKRYPRAALFSMLGGGGVTLFLLIFNVALPGNLDATLFGLTASLALYLGIATIERNTSTEKRI
ncbi:sodium:solute symporter family protein [bacterium]|nr:sodium:solute symporter family protein [bacterium]